MQKVVYKTATSAKYIKIEFDFIKNRFACIDHNLKGIYFFGFSVYSYLQ